MTPRVRALALGLTFVGGCGKCGGASAVAELVGVVGDVRADDAAAPVSFESASVGREFVLGEGLQTAPLGSAELILRGGGTLIVAPESLVRFERGNGGSRIEVAMGSVVVEATVSAPIEIETIFGVARLEAGSRAQLRHAGGERFEILIGRATVARATGVVTLAPGESLEDGESVAPAAVAQVARPPSGGEPPEVRAAAADGTPRIVSGDRAPAALSLVAGESIFVHDPSAPTRVEFEPPDGCTSSIRLLLTGAGGARELRGDGAIVVALQPGTHRYGVRCDGDETEVQGSVRVDRDAGRQPLSRIAPRNVVDADGRPYSILYQSVLPEIVVRWPGAPGGPCRLEVARAGRATRSIDLASPSHHFDSGELGDGSWEVAFVSANGDRSPSTRVRIQFDNTTPVAYLRSPSPGALVAPVRIDAVVAAGATVSVAGASLVVDDASRVDAEVPLPAAGGCFSVRVAVTGRATHHYVRCAR